MGVESSGSFIGVVLVLAAIAAALIYGYMEYQVRMLRTTATKLPAGLLFTSKFLTVGTRNTSHEVVVSAPMGRHASGASAVDLTRLQPRELSVVLPAIGLLCEVKVGGANPAGKASDRCTVTFTTSDAVKLQSLGLPAAPSMVAVVDNVPVPVARAFQNFAAQMALWIDRVESRIHLEREAEQKKSDDAAAALAFAEAAASRATDKAKGPKEDYSKAVSDDERKARIDKQIAALREAAGFKGNSAEFGADPNGKIQWLIDLEPSGKVILQSGSRTFHGSLKGAKLTTLTGELELGVRDALWSEDEPALSNFNIMAGAKAETRVAWKERLEILIRSVR